MIRVRLTCITSGRSTSEQARFGAGAANRHLTDFALRRLSVLQHPVEQAEVHEYAIVVEYLKGSLGDDIEIECTRDCQIAPGGNSSSPGTREKLEAQGMLPPKAAESPAELASRFARAIRDMKDAAAEFGIKPQ